METLESAQIFKEQSEEISSASLSIFTAIFQSVSLVSTVTEKYRYIRLSIQRQVGH